MIGATSLDDGIRDHNEAQTPAEHEIGNVLAREIELGTAEVSSSTA